MANGNGSLMNARVIDVLFKFVSALTLAGVLWIASSINQLDRRVTTIEATYITAGDVPPVWFREMVAQQSARLERLERAEGGTQ